MVASPYGFWRSPVTSDFVVADSIRLEQVALDGGVLYWSEGQPQKKGRSFVYRMPEGGEVEPVTPDDDNGFSVRTRVHEYGGGSFAVGDGVIYFSNDADQRLYRQEGGGQPRPITLPPTASDADGLRYADGVVDRRRSRLICVREAHSPNAEAVNALVSVDVLGDRAPRVLVSGADFYSTPRLNPTGDRLAWLSWNHPDMPWAATEAWVGDLTPDGEIAHARRVVGGPGESVFQPEWSPRGELHFVSDRGAGWWNLYRERSGAIEPLAPIDAEFGRPQWQFGMSTYAFEFRGSPDLMLRPRRRLDSGQHRHRNKAFRDCPERIHRHLAAPRSAGTGRLHRRLALGAAGADRLRSRQRKETGGSSLVHASRRHPSLCFAPSADRLRN